MHTPRNRILLFLFLSLIWSLIWFSRKSLLNPFFDQLPSLLVYLFGLVPTMGLLIGGIWMRGKMSLNKMTIGGTNQQYAWFIILLPALCLAVLGVNNSLGIQANLFGLLIGMFTLTYAFLEEFGWRGYLQEELTPMQNKWVVYAIIGTIWYLWHWYFLRDGSDPKWIMIPILMAASAGIGEIATSTRSILICAAFHGLANILMIYGVIARQLSNQEKIIILVVCLAVWIPLIRRMEHQVERP